MIKTIPITVNAENPQLPLMPSEPFDGSAATFVVRGVPSAHGALAIEGVAVNLTTVAGSTSSHAALKVGCEWIVTVPAEAVGASGSVGNGVIISASGKDERGNPIEQWILGAGDLIVLQQDGTVRPGTVRRTLHWFDERPESPKAGDVAPNPDAQAELELFDGETWRGFGGGGSVVLDDEVTEESENGVKSSGIWSWVTGLLSPITSAISTLTSSVSGLQSSKADKSTTYTKTETDTALAAKRGMTERSWTDETDAGIVFTVTNATLNGEPLDDTNGEYRFYVSGVGHGDSWMLAEDKIRTQIYRSSGGFVWYIGGAVTQPFDLGVHDLKVDASGGAGEAVFRCHVVGVRKTDTFALLSDIIARIAPAFAAKTGTGAYAEGAKVAYNGALYERNATAGADTSWVASHWDELADLSGVLSGLKSDGTATDQFATDLLGKPVAKSALMIPLETVEAGTSTITAEDGHAYAVTMTGTVTITMPTTTVGKAAIFQARFSAAAQQSVQFDTDDVVKFDGTDCGIVKAGKDALLSAMWNGEAWDLVWKNEA